MRDVETIKIQMCIQAKNTRRMMRLLPPLLYIVNRDYIFVV